MPTAGFEPTTLADRCLKLRGKQDTFRLKNNENGFQGTEMLTGILLKYTQMNRM
jgi:hypothetical protein